MRQETITYLSDKEEEFVSILTEVGMRKNVAKVLVFLTSTAKATSRMIERGVDLRQPEVSLALRDMAERGWIRSEKIPSDRNGRPNTEITLAMPAAKIMTAIENAAKEQANDQLALVKKMRSFA